jgi:adenylyl- and sulfurtransferase ThiI
MANWVGRNRPWFIRTFPRSIQSVLADYVRDVAPCSGASKCVLTGADWDEVRRRLARVPGIGNFARAEHVAPDLDAITVAVLAGVEGRTARNFRGPRVAPTNDFRCRRRRSSG